MVPALPDMFSFVRLSSGQRILIYEQMRPIAERRSHTLLLQRISGALAHERQTTDRDVRWSANEHKVLYGPEVKKRKYLIDRALTGIRDIALAQIAELDPRDPQHQRVRSFVSTVFPGGVTIISSMTFIDHVSAAQNVVDKLQGAFAPVVDELGLTRKVAALAALTARQSDDMQTPKPKLTYREVHEARERGRTLLFEIVGIVIGTYHDSSNPEHLLARNELLLPLVLEDKSTRAHRRERSAAKRRKRTATPQPAPSGQNTPGEPNDGPQSA